MTKREQQLIALMRDDAEYWRKHQQTLDVGGDEEVRRPHRATHGRRRMLIQHREQQYGVAA